MRHLLIAGNLFPTGIVMNFCRELQRQPRSHWFALRSSHINVTSGVTVEVARKCQAFAAKAFPPREAGNPAAGLPPFGDDDRATAFGSVFESADVTFAV
jgi:hypothetical protein